MKQLLLFLGLILSSMPLQASDFELRLKESLLNDLTDVVGTRKFTGSVKVGFVSKPYTISVNSLEIQSRSSGLTYEAELKVKFMGLTHYFDVEGGVNAQIYANRVSLSLQSLNFPIRIDIPLVGTVTLFTIRTSLSRRLDWRFFPAANFRIGDILIQGRMVNLSIVPRNQELVLRGDLSF